MKIFKEMKRKPVETPKNKVLLEDIQAEIERMEKKITNLNGLGVPMCWDLKRVITSGGKRLRPILAYLCYRMGGSQKLQIQPLMCMLELMHTASLIHDDVLDSAELRRGYATINATSGSEAAVQSGDFLLAEAMTYLHNYKGTGINEALVQASTDMCLGELTQLNMRYDLGKQTRELYFSQIFRKTASLIGASCYTGAIAGGLSESKAKMLRIYGEKLGISFQLVDDLLDFSKKPVFGKRPGQDLQNGIFTFPILHLLEEGLAETIEGLLVKKNKDDRDIDRLIEFIRETKALDYTKLLIHQKTTEAVNAICDFPDSVEKTALMEVAKELAERQV